MHRGNGGGERGWIINEHVKQEHDLALHTRGSILSLLSQWSLSHCRFYSNKTWQVNCHLSMVHFCWKIFRANDRVGHQSIVIKVVRGPESQVLSSVQNQDPSKGNKCCHRLPRWPQWWVHFKQWGRGPNTEWSICALWPTTLFNLSLSE